MRVGHDQMMTSILTQPNTDHKPNYSEISEDAKRYNNEIFKRVIAICPAWRASFKTADEAKAVRREWLIAFSQEPGITSESIEYAIGRLRETGTRFLPAIGEFIAWCREGRLPEKIKSVHESYTEICAYNCLPSNEREPSSLSPEVFHTLVSLHDVFGWKRSSKDKHKEIWKDQYQKTINHILNGGHLKRAPEPRKKLTGVTTPMSEASKQQKIQELKKMRQGLIA